MAGLAPATLPAPELPRLTASVSDTPGTGATQPVLSLALYPPEQVPGLPEGPSTGWHQGPTHLDICRD